MQYTSVYTEMEPERFDLHIARNTGFKSLADLVASRGSYRPSCDCSQPFMRALAYRFDSEMARRGDDRRAYLYGSDTEKQLARWGR